MGTTTSTTRNQNYDVPRSELNDDVPWSELNDDMLYLVMMRLGVVDFDAFSAVCKSWRSLALSNRKRFMASRLPMSIIISPPPKSMCICPFSVKKTYDLEDIEGRKFTTIIPQYGGECVGVTCGYLILFNKKANYLWLVNPITRRPLYFPNVPLHDEVSLFKQLRIILVFSPSMSAWIVVILNRLTNKIWFSIADTGAWNHVSYPFPICDIHAFKGKIYTLNNCENTRDGYQLCELRLNPHPKLVLLETKNFLKPCCLPNLTKNILKPSCLPNFVSSGEKLYVVHFIPGDIYSRHELDISKMKWVSCENTSEEFAFFCSWEQADVYKGEWWVDHWRKYGKYVDTKDNIGFYKDMLYVDKLYFPHDCLNVNLIHE